jgi:hypothetical protein
MTRRQVVWVSGLTAVAVLLGVVAWTNPLHWSEARIQQWALRKAPLGSSVADVKTLIEKQGWKLKYEWRGANLDASPREYPYVRGGHIIGAYFGHYQGVPWRADVDAFWGFDDEERLIDFHVRKSYDTL